MVVCILYQAVKLLGLISRARRQDSDTVQRAREIVIVCFCRFMDTTGVTTGYGIVLVTASSMQEAEAIATSLVNSKLAACVNLVPIQSIYTWQGKLHQEQEWHLLIKTDLSQFQAIVAKIRELHSYEVPEIIALPIVAGSQPYLSWISEQVQLRE